MKTTTITCDVIGCGKEGHREVECCKGWLVSDGTTRYKKFQDPIPPDKVDLCREHYSKWAEVTCKLLKMDKEIK